MKEKKEVVSLNFNYKIVQPKDKKVSQAGFWFTHTALSTTSVLIIMCKGMMQAIYSTPHRLWTRHITSCFSSHFNHAGTERFPSEDYCPPYAQELCTISYPSKRRWYRKLSYQRTLPYSISLEKAAVPLSAWLKAQDEIGVLGSPARHAGPTTKGTACYYEQHWEGKDLVGNNVGNSLWDGLQRDQAKEGWLDLSPALPAGHGILRQVTLPPPPPMAYFRLQGLQGKDCSSLCKKHST